MRGRVGRKWKVEIEKRDRKISWLLHKHRDRGKQSSDKENRSVNPGELGDGQVTPEGKESRETLSSEVRDSEKDKEIDNATRMAVETCRETLISETVVDSDTNRERQMKRERGSSQINGVITSTAFSS